MPESTLDVPVDIKPAEKIVENLGTLKIYMQYQYLPFKTFVEVQHIVVEAHDFLVKLFKLDESEYFQYYHMDVEEIHTGSLELNINFNFDSSKKKEESPKEKSGFLSKVKALTLVLGLVLAGEKVYVETGKVIETTKALTTQQDSATTKPQINQKYNDALKNSGILNQTMLAPDTANYMDGFNLKLKEAVSNKNIKILQIDNTYVKPSTGFQYLDF